MAKVPYTAGNNSLNSSKITIKNGFFCDVESKKKVKIGFYFSICSFANFHIFSEFLPTHCGTQFGQGLGRGRAGAGQGAGQGPRRDRAGNGQGQGNGQWVQANESRAKTRLISAINFSILIRNHCTEIFITIYLWQNPRLKKSLYRQNHHYNPVKLARSDQILREIKENLSDPPQKPR